MTEWAWVAIGYGATAMALTGYLVALLRGAAAVWHRAGTPPRNPR